MNLQDKNSRGYTLIEPDIYESLDWDLDIIVGCLNYIREKLPSILNVEKLNLEFDLIAMGNPHGPDYPVIGMHDLSNSFNIELDIIDQKVTDWVSELGIEELKKKVNNKPAISWEKLTEIRIYPIRS
jgi:hypothetical protein